MNLALTKLGVIVLAHALCGCGSSANGADDPRNEATGSDDSIGSDDQDTDQTPGKADDTTTSAASPSATGTSVGSASEMGSPSGPAHEDGAELGGSSTSVPSSPDTSEPSSEDVPGAQAELDNPQQAPGSQPDAVSDDGSEQSAGHIWYYVGADTAGVVSNILGDTPEVVIFNGVDQNLGTFPWSPDGRQVAQISRGEVVFYELGDEATITGSYAAAQYKTVRAWIPNFGVLLEGTPNSQPLLGIMQPDGTDIVLGESEYTAAPYRVSVSPNGLHLLWTTDSTEGGYDIWRTSFVGGVASEPALLAHYDGSPMLEATWSPNSEWMAYAISGAVPETGVYFWQAGSDTTVKVSLEGASYTPYIGFSSDGSSFAMNLFDGTPTGDEQPGATLAVLSIGPYGPGVAQAVSSAQHPDPIRWASHGNQFFHMPDGMGTLQQLQSDATPLPAIPFPTYNHGSQCSVHWLSETQFVYNGCLESSALTFASVRDGSILTTEVAPISLYHLELGPGGNCLMEWDETTIRTSPANADDYTQNPIPTQGGIVSHASFTPDGEHVVWTEDGVAQYRMELVNCAPSSEAIHFRNSTTEVARTTFLALPND